MNKYVILLMIIIILALAIAFAFTLMDITSHTDATVSEILGFLIH